MLAGRARPERRSSAPDRPAWRPGDLRPARGSPAAGLTNRTHSGQEDTGCRPAGVPVPCASGTRAATARLASVARILVVEPVAQAGIDLLAAAHETDVRLNLSRAE